MTTKPPLKRRENVHSVRLKLACCCGKDRTLWVDPDSPVKQAAAANGWSLRDGYWECPECSEKPG